MTLIGRRVTWTSNKGRVRATIADTRWFDAGGWMGAGFILALILDDGTPAEVQFLTVQFDMPMVGESSDG
jgi:hypothetical protein